MKVINPSPLSFSTIPVAMHFKETKALILSGTSFIYEYDKKLYLITNWHVVTGVSPKDKKPIMAHGGIPNIMVLSLLLKQKQTTWSNFTLDIYIDNKAQWLVHPKYKEIE